MSRPYRPSRDKQRSGATRLPFAALLVMVALFTFAGAMLLFNAASPADADAGPRLASGPPQAFAAAPTAMPSPVAAPAAPPSAPSAPPPAEADGLRARFGLCHTGGGTNCVVDGDTFWFQGQKIRIAGIDTPETHPARCAEEAARGEAATQRLLVLLNAGAFSLHSIDRDTDRYGRLLRTVTRGGRDLGEVLIDEGLARPYAGGMRAGWC